MVPVTTKPFMNNFIYIIFLQGVPAFFFIKTTKYIGIIQSVYSETHGLNAFYYIPVISDFDLPAIIRFINYIRVSQ